MLLQEYFTALDNLIYDDDGSLVDPITAKVTKPVYIVLVYTGTWLAHITRYYFNDVYTHAALALNKDLKELYATDFRKDSFLVEDIKTCLKGAPDSTFSVYQVNVPVDVFNNLKNRIEDLKNNVVKVNYNKWGIIGLALNTPLGKANSYLCSEFIAKMLEISGYPLYKRTPLSLIRPYDYVRNRKLKLFFKGKLKDYKYFVEDPEPVVKSKFSKIKEKLPDSSTFSRLNPFNYTIRYDPENKLRNVRI